MMYTAVVPLSLMEIRPSPSPIAMVAPKSPSRGLPLLSLSFAVLSLLVRSAHRCVVRFAWNDDRNETPHLLVDGDAMMQKTNHTR